MSRWLRVGPCPGRVMRHVRSRDAGRSRCSSIGPFVIGIYPYGGYLLAVLRAQRVGQPLSAIQYIIPGWERESPIGSVAGSLLVNFNNLHDICLYV